MTAKQFGTDIEVIEIIRDFNVELFFNPNSLRHGKMDTYLDRCLVNSFSIINNILQSESRRCNYRKRKIM